MSKLFWAERTASSASSSPLMVATSMPMSALMAATKAAPLVALRTALVATTSTFFTP